MKVQKVTNHELERILEQERGTVVADFYADWCGPCKMLSGVYEAVADELPGVLFCKLNVEEEEEAARRYDVRSVPTVLVFRDGKRVAASHGFVSKARLREVVVTADRVF